MKRIFGFLMVCLSLSVCAGCKTYRTERIYDDCVKFRGVPVQVFKTHQIEVTWMMGPEGYAEKPASAGDGSGGGSGGGPKTQPTKSSTTRNAALHATETGAAEEQPQIY